jgi:hypothetical protein
MLSNVLPFPSSLPYLSLGYPATHVFVSSWRKRGRIVRFGGCLAERKGSKNCATLGRRDDYLCMSGEWFEGRREV